ncbi:MAG: type I secretion system permease/ATPase [Burkholderiales bacterium]|nr:type I secretion system permease/ATPase [Burkholderiales bacterium]
MTAAIPAGAPAVPAAAATPAAPDTPAPVPAKGVHPLWPILRRFRAELFWVALFGLVSNLLMLTPTLYMIQVFDRVFASNSEYTLAALSFIALVLFLVMGFADWARSRLLVRAGTRFDELAQPLLFGASFDDQLRGRTSQGSQAFSDLTQLRQFLTGNGAFAVVDAPWVFIYAAALYLIHPWLGWLAAFFVLLTLAIALVGNHFVGPRHRSAQQSLLKNHQYLQGKLRNAEAVYAMGMLGHLRARWIELHDRVDDTTREAAHAGHRLQALIKFVQYAQGSLVLALGAVLAIEGDISAGAMIACNALMSNALRPIGLIVQSWRPMLDARAAYARLRVLMERNPPRAAAHAAEQIEGRITLRDLSARAPGRPAPILDGLNAEFGPGEVIAVAGPSGAGKSTLARCLLGLWPDTQEQVLLDGVPLAQWSRQALGRHVGYLPQDIELFDGSIAENIARFAPDMEEQVVTAARRCGIHDMILRLPRGYDTPMGEAGAFLSGGQRQRIGLARAILGDPRIVVLDEPTSNLDDVGEMALLRAVAELKAQRRTVFMIVHQPHLLGVADRLLVLQGGRIAQLAKIQHPAPSAAATPTP